MNNDFKGYHKVVFKEHQKTNLQTIYYLFKPQAISSIMSFVDLFY